MAALLQSSLNELEAQWHAAGLLAAGDVDLAVTFDYDDSPSSAAPATRHLLDDQLLLVLPPDHRLADRTSADLADVAAERWIAGCPRCRAPGQRRSPPRVRPRHPPQHRRLRRHPDPRRHRPRHRAAPGPGASSGLRPPREHGLPPAAPAPPRRGGPARARTSGTSQPRPPSRARTRDQGLLTLLLRLSRTTIVHRTRTVLPRSAGERPLAPPEPRQLPLQVTAARLIRGRLTTNDLSVT